jgi:hypothetical protein
MTITKEQTLDKKHTQQTIEGILQLFQSYGNPNTKPSRQELERFFTSNLEIFSNDHTAVRNVNEFVERIQQIQQHFSSLKYSKLLESPIIAGNKAIIRYNVDLTTTNSKKTQFQIIAILTFDGEKVSQWTEVIHEKGTSRWDS